MRSCRPGCKVILKMEHKIFLCNKKNSRPVKGRKHNLSFYHLLQHTSICAPDNGGIPSVLTYFSKKCSAPATQKWYSNILYSYQASTIPGSLWFSGIFYCLRQRLYLYKFHYRNISRRRQELFVMFFSTFLYHFFILYLWIVWRFHGRIRIT